MRTRWIWITLLVILVALGGAAYWVTRPPRAADPSSPEVGLAWLPAEAVMVGSVDARALRQQTWLPELIERSVPAEPEADYREFVAATGFDYARDLDRLWLALLADGPTPEVVGVAQGRFEPARLSAYAEGQGAGKVSLGHYAVYRLEQENPARRFVFTFLDASTLAFAETLAGVEKVLACVEDGAPSVADEPGRRAELERFAAGLQAWVVHEDVARWTPPGLARKPELAAQLRQLAAGARTTADGLELVAEGETFEAAQAERLQAVLQMYGVIGQALLSVRNDPPSQALRETLSTAFVQQRGNWLRVQLRFSRAALAALLASDTPHVPRQSNNPR